MTVRAPFKYTLPITRAFEQDGELYIRGEASGPEVDLFDTRMDPALIDSFAGQIQTRAAEGMPLVYRDTHNPDGVLTELGELVEASVTDTSHLYVTVRLDRENPAAKHLHAQLLRGKKYGMSIGGTVVDYVDEYVESMGRVIRRFTNVVLDHIANTTMPAWTPSLGTVLTRAVEKALTEESTLENEELAPEQPETEGEQESTATEGTTEESTEETPETPAVEEAAEEHTHEEEAETPAAEEEPAEARMIEATALAPVAEAAQALVTALAALTAPAAADEAPAAEAAEPTDAARSVESESPVVAGNDELAVLRSAVESLRTELASANDRIRQLEAEPAGDQPDVIQRTEPDLMEELGKLDPHVRLVAGLQAAKAANQ